MYCGLSLTTNKAYGKLILKLGKRVIGGVSGISCLMAVVLFASAAQADADRTAPKRILSVDEMRLIKGGTGCDEDCTDYDPGCADPDCYYCGLGDWHKETDRENWACEYSEDPPPGGCEDVGPVWVICADVWHSDEEGCPDPVHDGYGVYWYILCRGAFL